MRASEVRAELISQLESITPDSAVGGRDRLRHVELRGREPERPSSRSFALELGRVRPSRTMGDDLPTVGYDLQVFYPPSEAVEDRMAEDAERIEDALYQAPLTKTDIAQVSLASGDVQRLDGLLVMPWVIDVTYRRDSF